MSRRRAIYLKCLDCCGDSWKEVLICQVFDCPLWPFRTGDNIGSTRYKKRIKAAFAKKTEDITELQKQGVDMPFFRTEYRKNPSNDFKQFRVRRGGSGEMSENSQHVNFK